MQAEVDSSILFYPDHISSYTLSGGLYLYYNWLPKVTVGIGGTAGYDWVDDPTTNQTFEQINARLNYEVTAKVGLYASGGVEFRQFNGNRDTYTTPVFEIGSTYHPFEGTTITLAVAGGFTIPGSLLTRILRPRMLWPDFSSVCSSAFISAWAAAMKTRTISPLTGTSLRRGMTTTGLSNRRLTS